MSADSRGGCNRRPGRGSRRLHPPRESARLGAALHPGSVPGAHIGERRWRRGTGALGLVEVSATGSILANGDGGSARSGGAGGGPGGGISVHADAFTLEGALSVVGGTRGAEAGDGGGGRVRIVVAQGPAPDPALINVADVNTGGRGGGEGPGTVDIVGPIPVPEPSALVLLGLGGGALAWVLRTRRGPGAG